MRGVYAPLFLFTFGSMKGILRHLAVSIFIFTSLNQAWSQSYQLLFQTHDTTTYQQRILTTRLDSIALLQSGYTTLNPGGNQLYPSGELQSDYLNSYSNFQIASPKWELLENTYSGLPHLGFYYSFGSRGIQNIRVDYQQTFAKKFNVNLRYTGNHLNKDAGFMRNGGYTNNIVQFLSNYHGKHYNGQYYLNYYYGKRRSGVQLMEDSLLLLQPIQLIPVENESAFSKLNFAQAGTQHQFYVTKDSSIRQGIIYQNQLNIHNRKYSESKSTLSNYDFIYLDSTGTYDQYFWGQIRNELGYFIDSKHFSVSARAFHQYWKYDNYTYRQDTSEIGIAAEIKLIWNRISFQSHLDMTFLGAVGAINSQSSMNWKIINDLSFHAFLDFENQYPSVFFRNYQGNSIQWKTQSVRLQQTLKTGGTLSWNKKIPLKFGAGFIHLSNHYWLIDNQLRNDTLKNITLLNIHLKSEFKVRTFHFDPYLAMNFTSKNARIAPLIDARLNIYWNQKLFSTKKFDFILGITARYTSKVSLVSYNQLVDSYQFTNTTSSTFQPILRLDVYTGFQIDNFRFFLRYENIDSFWNSKRNYTLLHYPIAPGVIHIGLTWDFFN